jgi:hypothetical protein
MLVNRSFERIRLVPVVVAALVLVGCGGGSDVETIQGSCRTGVLDDGSRLCVEYFDTSLAKDFRPVCTTVMRGEWSEGGCDTTGALGGCRLSSSQSLIWVYPSRKHGSVDEVERYCEDEGGVFTPVD